jgi:molybdate transport system substrate-binding protein
MRVLILRLLLLLPLSMCLAIAPPPTAAQSLLLAADIDLRPVVDPLLQRYAQLSGGATAQAVYGHADVLQREIEAGSPFDLLLAADMLQPQRLLVSGHAVEPVLVLAENRLVIWANGDIAPGIQSLRSRHWQPVAVVQPLQVPYGQRTAQALQSAGLSNLLQPHLIYAPNVASAAQLVADGTAASAIITSAQHVAGLGGRGAVEDVDAALHAPLSHGMVLTLRGAGRDEARALFEWLQSEQAVAMLQAQGLELAATVD